MPNPPSTPTHPRPLWITSYSPADEDLATELAVHLRGIDWIDVWTPDVVPIGHDTEQAKATALVSANVALVLLSAEYLASSDLVEEARALHTRSKRDGLTMIPVLLKDCHWEGRDWLRRLDLVPRSKTPMASLPREARDRAWKGVLEEALRRERASFATWLISVLVVLVVACTALGLLVAGVRERRTWEIARTVVDAAQLAVLLCIFGLVWDRHKPKKSKDPATECRRQFIIYWENLWLVWLSFYALHVGREVVELRVDPRIKHWLPMMNIGTTFLHNHQSLTLLLLFWMMIRPTLDPEGRPYRTKRWSTPVWISCVFFAAIQGALLLWFQQSEHRVFMVDLVAAIVSGVGAATCMGMFVGRLESRFLDVHPAELFVLYLYAGTQPLFPVLRALRSLTWTPDYLPALLEMLLKGLALSLKLGLFFVVLRQIEGGRLAFYMKEVRLLRDEVLQKWHRSKHER